MNEAEKPQSQLLVFDSAAALYRVAEGYVQRLAEAAVQERGSFLFALSGGSTPQPLFRRLADPHSLPWACTHVFWGDERMVPPDDPESNYHQAASLLLDHVPVPPSQIHRIPGEEDPVSAAEMYAQTLRATAGDGAAWPRFDLALLGLGADGHTASLFPGSAFPIAPEVATEAVLAKTENRPPARVTLTAQVFNSARHVIFLVRGEEKAEALAHVLEGEYKPRQWPAQRIHPADGNLLWFVDEAAASRLVSK